MKKMILSVIALLAIALQAHAQSYPTRPIRIVVPFGPGGFTDVAARILQKELAPAIGQPIVIENKPGAGSTIGTTDVARSAPDGYSLVMISTAHVISPHLYKQMPYDPIKDFTPVMKLAEGPYVLVVHPSLPVKNVADLIALAKAKPNSIDYASSGNGSAQHLVGALFVTMAGAPLSHVPYKGSSQAMNDVLGGIVKVSFVGVPNALANLQAGKIKALAVTSPARSPAMPDVPTMKEAGVAPADVELRFWFAIFGPKGLSAPVKAKLSQAVTKVMTDPKVAERLAKLDITPDVISGPAMHDKLVSEIKNWTRFIDAKGIKAE